MIVAGTLVPSGVLKKERVRVLGITKTIGSGSGDVVDVVVVSKNVVVVVVDVGFVVVVDVGVVVDVVFVVDVGVVVDVVVVVVVDVGVVVVVCGFSSQSAS